MYSVNNCDDASIKQSEQAQKTKKQLVYILIKKTWHWGGGGGGCMG